MFEKKNRTIRNLREKFEGKIFVYLADEKIRKEFAEDAEKEGFTIGGQKPTERDIDEIMSLHEDTLTFVGGIGRMEFMANGGSNEKGNFHRVDYAKYKGGEKDYIIKKLNYPQERQR